MIEWNHVLIKNQSETIKYGKKLAPTLHGGDILCLYGNLGAGKTTLVKGLAAGLGVTNEITSPTFALMNIFDIKIFPPPPKAGRQADQLRPRRISPPRRVEKHQSIKTLFIL